MNKKREKLDIKSQKFSYFQFVRLYEAAPILVILVPKLK